MKVYMVVLFVEYEGYDLYDSVAFDTEDKALSYFAEMTDALRVAKKSSYSEYRIIECILC